MAAAASMAHAWLMYDTTENSKALPPPAAPRTSRRLWTAEQSPGQPAVADLAVLSPAR